MISSQYDATAMDIQRYHEGMPSNADDDFSNFARPPCIFATSAVLVLKLIDGSLLAAVLHLVGVISSLDFIVRVNACVPLLADDPGRVGDAVSPSSVT